MRDPYNANSDIVRSSKVQSLSSGKRECCRTKVAAIYVKQADKVFVTLADGTVNSLSNGGMMGGVGGNGGFGKGGRHG